MFFLHLKQDFSNFCPIPCFINSFMDEVQVGVIYNTLLDSNEGDLSPHASQTIYFSNINENKISDRETPVELLSLEPQYGTEPLLISYISITRHSEASSCCSPLNDITWKIWANVYVYMYVYHSEKHSKGKQIFEFWESCSNYGFRI